MSAKTRRRVGRRELENRLAGARATGRSTLDLQAYVDAEEVDERARTLQIDREARRRVEAAGGPTLSLSPASAVKVRPVRWLWADRLPLGMLALIAGREGVGKSTVGYSLAADITRGRLAGEFYGTPRAVIIAATEDSWEHTIVPRLMAAGADLERVFRVETAGTSDTLSISLPRDLAEMRRLVREASAALVLLDPLMSRIDGGLNTHVDAEVRQALEPLGAMAAETEASIVGIIHVTKATSVDALSRIMGSRAFTAVPRAALFCTVDPEDDGRRLLGQPKNNLGRSDLPTLVYRIEAAKVADTAEGPVITGRLVWCGEQDRSIDDALAEAEATPEHRTATADAVEWLREHLSQQPDQVADSSTIKKAARAAGFSIATLKIARQRAGVDAETSGFPRRTTWRLRQSANPSPSTNQLGPLSQLSPLEREKEEQLAKSAKSAKSATARQTAGPLADPACQSCGSELCELPLKDCVVARHHVVKDIGELIGIESISVERIQ